MRVCWLAFVRGEGVKNATEPGGLHLPSWQQVAIGGGGYVLQVHFHPTTSHTYMRTDVGGIYRREAAPSINGGPPWVWVPLLDWAGPDNDSYYSVSALAMGPETGADLYILTGGYWAYVSHRTTRPPAHPLCTS